ncbi:hypothetical protein ZWY2020_035545 [Hordeum vulgare]|nr:hypothetical protein ZWY2020_035545 [Hordeum vulgare]
MDGSGAVALPSDLLLEILRRLPGHALAVSRCVCRAWRDLIGAHTHALLLPQVFPREFPGVFGTYHGYDPGFALFGPPPPSGGAHVPGYRRLLWDHWDCHVNQHCNGLLLVTGKLSFNRHMVPYVCNPATSRYARLPCPPTPWPCSVEGMFLAFDPAVSRHHEVFFFPTEKLERNGEDDDWPPNLFGQDQPSEPKEEEPKVPKENVLHVLVFSSRTGQWESRKFTPGRCAPGNLYDVVTTPRCKDQRTWWSAEYWHGSLYVHCHSGVLMILRCYQGTYQMVQLPGHPCDREILYQWSLPTRYLGSCNRGIRYAVVKDFLLQVWDLMELADDPLGWTLAHRADLKIHDRMMRYLSSQPGMEPRMTWEVASGNKDLISLFERGNNEKVNDGCDDGTGDFEDGGEEDDQDNYDEAQDEEDELEDNDDETQGEEKEEQDIYDDETQGEEKEEQDSYVDDGDEIQGEEKEEQDNYDDDDDDDEIQGEDKEEQDNYDDDDDDDDDGDKNDDEEEEEFRSRDGSDYSWNSDEHNVIDYDNITIPEEDLCGWGCSIVGFHPYKDALLLKFNETVGTYHLHTCRMQYVGGYIYPENHHQQARDIDHAFPYRPCYVDALPPRKMSPSS